MGTKSTSALSRELTKTTKHLQHLSRTITAQLNPLRANQTPTHHTHHTHRHVGPRLLQPRPSASTASLLRRSTSPTVRRLPTAADAVRTAARLPTTAIPAAAAAAEG